MRIPHPYTASEIVNWHNAEEYAPGKWRPARNCGYTSYSWFHIKMRFQMAWAVFTGKADALFWGKTSGEVKATERRYKDCTKPEFFSATKVYEPPE